MAFVYSAGVIWISYDRIYHQDFGFSTNNLLMVEVPPPMAVFAGPDPVAEMARTGKRIEQAIRGLPTVSSVAHADVPFGTMRSRQTVATEDSNGLTRQLVAKSRTSGPAYFHTLGATMVAGRDFAEGDESTTAPVAIVNRSLARELWPLGAALDRYMTVNKTRYRVIGVCPDFADDRPGTAPGLQVFLPKAWESRFVVRTRGNSQAEIDRILRIVARVEPRAEATVAAYDTFRARQSASERAYVQFMLSIVIAAMLIAGFGVYAVVTQSVRVNAKQVGIHLAIDE